jgi:hypothetical protein
VRPGESAEDYYERIRHCQCDVCEEDRAIEQDERTCMACEIDAAQAYGHGREHTCLRSPQATDTKKEHGT